MSVVVVISQHLLNVFVQLANKRGLKKKKISQKMATFITTAVRTSKPTTIIFFQIKLEYFSCRKIIIK
jgi:hypothetical protein